MSIGTINANSVTTENRHEQEYCSLDIYCLIVFIPYSICESQMDILSRAKAKVNYSELGMASYIGDIHCQRIIYSNCILPKGDVIEDTATIVVDCSDTSSQLYLDENTILPKISFARQSLQNLLYKYIGYQATFHIGVIGYTLTEDFAKCFSYYLHPDDCLLPEDIGIACQIRNRLKYQLNVPHNSRINLDFVINYDTFPVVISKNPHLSEDEYILTKEPVNKIDDRIDVSNNTSERTIEGENLNGNEVYDNNVIKESPLLLQGGVSKNEYLEKDPAQNNDILRNTLYLLNPLAAVIYSANVRFVNYIRTDEGKIWWNQVSDNIHLSADIVRDNANKLTGWLFNAAMVGYAVAGTMFVGSGFAATPLSIAVATGSTLILFGSGVAATISSIATVADVYTYIYDYISDPIQNGAALDSAFNEGTQEIKNYVISKITGSAGKKIQSKIPKPKKPKKSHSDQLKRERELLSQDKEAQNKNKTERELLQLEKEQAKRAYRAKREELLQLENENANSAKRGSRRVGYLKANKELKKANKKHQEANKKFQEADNKLLNDNKKLQNDILKRNEKIRDLYAEIIQDQSSSTLEDVFSNISGGVLNEIDSKKPEE